MERFTRDDTARNTDGNGLGLSIIKSLTELQGGKFEIAVDGDQAVAGPDAGFGGGGMRGDAINENGHGFFSKASEIGGAADKNGKMTRRGPQAGLCPVKAG